MKTSNPPLSQWEPSLTYCGVIPDAGVLGFGRELGLLYNGHFDIVSRLVMSRAHTGQGYLAVGPGFGCMSPVIRRSRSCVRPGRRRSGLVVELRISSTAAKNPLRRTADCQDKGYLDLKASYVA